jgi:methyltransferase-like protein 6
MAARTSTIPNTDPRNLTAEELEKLQKEECISDFKRNKLETDAKKNWDLFYKRNSTNFFKDRHWLTREFPELVDEVSRASDRTVLLEAGCGVGNTIFPLLEEYGHLFVYACDFSPRAVEYVKSNPLYSENRCYAFQCDLIKDSLVKTISQETVDLVSLIFVMSAITPSKMADAISNISGVLKPGGCVLLRDYGLYDHAMLRFGRGHKIQEHFYTRQDGTMAYFFSVGWCLQSSAVPCKHHCLDTV